MTEETPRERLAAARRSLQDDIDGLVGLIGITEANDLSVLTDARESLIVTLSRLQGVNHKEIRRWLDAAYDKEGDDE